MHLRQPIKIGYSYQLFLGAVYEQLSILTTPAELRKT
jgi:hypothetical protein